MMDGPPGGRTLKNLDVPALVQVGGRDATVPRTDHQGGGGCYASTTGHLVAYTGEGFETVVADQLNFLDHHVKEDVPQPCSVEELADAVDIASAADKAGRGCTMHPPLTGVIAGCGRLPAWMRGVSSVARTVAPEEEASMKRTAITLMLVAGLLFMTMPAGWAGAGTNRNFVAHLSGGEEVPPADTKATGQAKFQLSKDGTELSFRVNVANIENVTQAHIHLAPAGANGGVVVWLYPEAPPAQLIPGRTQGALAKGTITADDLVGALAGLALDDLVEEMKAGNAYVNVHTSQFPGGEIRGQIR